jgi:hypothetical protein
MRAFGNFMPFGDMRLLMTPRTSEVAGFSGGLASLGCHADHQIRDEVSGLTIDVFNLKTIEPRRLQDEMPQYVFNQSQSTAGAKPR